MSKLLFVLLLFSLSSCCCKKRSATDAFDPTRSNFVILTNNDGEFALYVREDRLKDTGPIEMDDNLVKIDPKEYNIEVDIRYAKNTNFTCTTEGLKCFKGYKYEFLYLHKDTAEKLRLASKIANDLGYKIIVWDGWRPYEAQDAFYQFVLDDRYFSSPTGIAGHTRGVAIDLGLINIKTGKVLDCGTDFDSFHARANQFSIDEKTSKLSLPNLTKKQLLNRILLNGIMNSVGLHSYQHEWWHFISQDQIYGITKYPKYKAGKRKAEFVNGQDEKH